MRSFIRLDVPLFIHFDSIAIYFANCLLLNNLFGIVTENMRYYLCVHRKRAGDRDGYENLCELNVKRFHFQFPIFLSP